MEKNKYNDLDKKINDIETKIVPILFTPRNPETTLSDKTAVDEFHRSLRFMNNLLAAEMASSAEPQRLADAIKRVTLLQKAARAWSDGRHLTPSTESGGSTPCSLIESCLTDDDGVYDYRGEVSGVAGFTVYDNPLFVGVPGDVNDNDNDGDDDNSDVNYDADDSIVEGSEEEDVTGFGDQEDVQQSELVIEDEVQETGTQYEGVEKEVIRVDSQQEENQEEESDDEEEGSRNCCCKIVFWGMIITVGVLSIMVGVPDFPDHYSPEMFLTPT